MRPDLLRISTLQKVGTTRCELHNFSSARGFAFGVAEDFRVLAIDYGSDFVDPALKDFTGAGQDSCAPQRRL